MSIVHQISCDGPTCSETTPATGPAYSPPEDSRWIVLQGSREKLHFHMPLCAGRYWLAQDGLRVAPLGAVILSLEDAELVRDVFTRGPYAALQLVLADAINAARAELQQPTAEPAARLCPNCGQPGGDFGHIVDNPTAYSCEPAVCPSCDGEGHLCIDNDHDETCKRCRGSGRKEG